MKQESIGLGGFKIHLTDPWEVTGNEFTKRKLTEAKDWLNEMVRNLPEMKISETNLTDGTLWRADIDIKNGETRSINGKHFNIGGIRIDTPSLTWNQPILKQITEVADTTDGELNVSGLVLLMRSPKHKIFLVVAQEPGVSKLLVEGKETHPIIRTPIQTSVTKLQQIMDDQEKADPILFKILKSFSQENGESVVKLMNSMSFTKVSTDGNRISSDVLYGLLDLNNQTVENVQKLIPVGRWCSEQEVAALCLMGKINGHSQVALNIANEYDFLRGPFK
jgi:hypothetical protein